MSDYLNEQKTHIFQMPTERSRLAAWRLCFILEYRRNAFPSLSFGLEADPHTSDFAGVIRTNCYVIDSDEKGPVTFQIMPSGWFRARFAQNNMFIGDGTEKKDVVAFMDKFFKLKKSYGLLPPPEPY